MTTLVPIHIAKFTEPSSSYVTAGYQTIHYTASGYYSHLWLPGEVENTYQPMYSPRSLLTRLASVRRGPSSQSGGDEVRFVGFKYPVTVYGLAQAAVKLNRPVIQTEDR